MLPEAPDRGHSHIPSRSAAEAWYGSPGYQAILPLRLQSMTCNAIIVDGAD
ncbi:MULTISPECIES: DUF1330 domain-containing protein [unclassified Mesorhizobium]|uniref:DUF1330 domain-containing protein n=1 Tax=unclassified Mesorhizobium TaxID=325217 RepID=UPI003335B283